MLTNTNLRWRRQLANLVVWLLIALAAVQSVRQTHAKAIANPNDFVTLYAGSTCMADDCDPYSVPQLEAVLVHARGTAIRQDWWDQLPIYPPTIFFLLLPLSHLSYGAATTVWYALGLLVYLVGLCWVYFVSPVRDYAGLAVRCAMVLLALHSPKMMQCVGFGNPALVVTGLLLFSAFDEAESRRAARWGALAIACLLKPPLAVPLATFLIWRERKRGREVLAVAGSFLLVVMAMSLYASGRPGMHQWRTELLQNIALGEHSGMSPSIRNQASNSILNFAMLPGYFTTNELAIRTISLGAMVLIGVAFVWIIGRLPATQERSTSCRLLTVACVATWTLLPVYHRFCDLGVLLLVIPWVLYEFAHGPSVRAWLSVPILALLYVAWQRHVNPGGTTGLAFKVEQFLYFRGDPLLVLALFCLLLWGLFLAGAPYSRTQRTRGVWSPERSA